MLFTNERCLLTIKLAENGPLHRRVVKYTRTVTVRIIHVTIRTDRKDLNIAYSA